MLTNGYDHRITYPGQISHDSVNLAESLLQAGGKILAIVVLVGMGVMVLETVISAFEKQKPRRRRRRPYNDRPLDQKTKEEVALRDGPHCTYCGVYVTRATRHIDHSVSRANGGTNRKNNLRVACRDCNLSKGAANGKDFTRRRRSHRFTRRVALYANYCQ